MSVNSKIIGHPNANDEHPSEGLCPRFSPADIISENVPSPIPRTIHIQTGSVESDEICRRFSLSEIRRATNNFDDYLVIGQGGFGKVYKGLFVDYGRPIVAIKRLNAKSVQGAGEFWAEIMTLSKLRHGNLVNLIGYCDECQEMILVYEYVANGTLADHLYRKRQGSNDYIYHPLSWEQRLKICIGAARGLDYLHSDSEQSVIHRDVKTANILLDENWVAKISDFGLSKKMCATTHTQTHITTDIKGTFGYVDPEYFFTHRLTKKSDVYAFGVVLLEVLCARPPVERVEEEQFRSLSEWAQQCIKKRKFDQIIDPYLRGEISPSSLKLFADLAVKCLHKCPKERPAMAQLAERLEFALALQRRQPKAIITNYFSKVIKGLGVSLGFWIWKRYCSNSGLFLRFWRDPILGGKTVKQYRRFSLEKIRAATNNFHDHLVMSHSSYYSDYKGLIDSGNLEVAIRRWKDGASNDNNLGQCRTEIMVQSQLRHLHIVSLIGYCKDKREIILVYDYMSNGSLHHHLHHNRTAPLPWEKRLDICIDAARGLQYLHAGTKLRIIHNNIKSSNILLEDNWVAKISSFDFSAVLPEKEPSTACNLFVTNDNMNCTDPECLATGKLTTKSDVYSFGVILLEILCGRKPLFLSEEEDQINLVRWFQANMESNTVDRIVDGSLINKIAPECLEEYVNLASYCVRDKGIERPSMDDVLGSLWCARQLQETWRNLNRPRAEVTADEAPQRSSISRDGMISYTSLDEFDYFSGNLAR